MNRDTPLDRKLRKDAVKLLRKLQKAGYDSHEITGFMLAAIEVTCPDVTAEMSMGDMVITGDVNVH